MPGRLAVAPRPADLLVVGVGGVGHVVGVDEADVGLVDHHAEGGGGDDDVEPVAGEGGLHLPPAAGPHATVVGLGSNSPVDQGRSHVRGDAAGGGVDDAHARPAGGVHDAVDEGGPLGVAVGEAKHLEGDGGPVEATDHHQGVA